MGSHSNTQVPFHYSILFYTICVHVHVHVRGEGGINGEAYRWLAMLVPLSVSAG